MNTPQGFSKNIKGGVPLPLLQSVLIGAGAVTQILSGSIPGKSSVKTNAENFCNSANIVPTLSEETKKAIDNFKNGVILINHPNKIMVDFPPLLQHLDEDVTNRLKIATGKTVTPMYRILLPHTETFCAEVLNNGDKKRLEADIDQTVSEIEKKTRVGFLPYFGSIQAVHRRILHSLGSETPILDVQTTFPSSISYINGGKFGPTSMYGRLIGNHEEIQVQVEAELKTAREFHNQ